MRVLWLHLRNSPLRWALPVLVLGDLAALFLRNRYWIGVWPETGAAAQVPAYLLGVVGAGAAAWVSSAPVRQGMGEQLRVARAHPAVLESYRLGATVIMLLVPYLIGQLVAFVCTARTFPPGVILWVGYACYGVFVLLVAVVLGWLCGKTVGPVFAALVSSLAFLFATSLLGRWSGFFVLTGRPEKTIEPVALVLRLAAILVLLLALLWLGVPGRTRRTTLGLASATLSLVAVMVGTDVVVDRQPPGDDVLCDEGRMMLCVWPEHEKYLSELRELNARVDLLPEAFTLPERVNEPGFEKKRYIVWTNGKTYEAEPVTPVFYVLEEVPGPMPGTSVPPSPPRRLPTWTMTAATGR